MRTILVGEAWGRHEAEFKHPLVGPSGRELTLELAIANFAPYMNILCRKCKLETRFMSAHCEHCQEHIWPNEFTLLDHWKRLKLDHQIHVTNVFQAQPPGNDLGHFFGTVPETDMTGWKASKKSGGSHVKAEHHHHIKRLYSEIRDLKPNLIVAMGNAACWALLDQTKITSLRGTVAWSQRLGVKVLPTFHPAAVLRQPPMRVSVTSDYTKAARERMFPEIVRPERWIYIVDPDPEGLARAYEWLAAPARAYAVDIETWRGQISMIGFARDKSNSLVIPFRNQDGSNHWPTPELEFDAWKLAIFGLQTSVPKIFQNGVYDLSYFIKLGIHVRNATHDTMLWHHSEYPELPKSLGFLGSIYANDLAWKTMVRHTSLKRDE